MRNLRTFLLVVVCTIAATAAHAQCERVRADWVRLSANTVLPAKQLAAQATALQTRWAGCKLPVDTTWVQITLFTGNQYRQQGQHADAARHFQRALQAATANPACRSLMAQAEYLLGTAYLYDGQAKRATTAFMAVLRQKVWPGDNLKWGIKARINLAYLSASSGDYRQALTYAEAGSRQAEKLNDPYLVAQLLREKANALYWLFRYDEAGHIVDEAIDIATNARETDMLPQLYLMLGDIEGKRKRSDAAVKAYQTVLRLLKKADDPALRAVVLNNLGFLYYGQKEYNQALRTYREALRIETNPANRVRLLDNIGSVLCGQGQFAAALRTYQRALVAMPNAGFRTSDITKNPAASCIQSVLQREYLLTTMQDKASAWLDYGVATGNRQYLHHALVTYSVADQMIDYMRWEHIGQETKLFWRTKTRNLYERAIETCWRLGDTDAGFRFFEKSRAVMLADKLNELGARQQLTTQQAALEQKLQESVDSQQRMLATESPGSRHDSLRAVLLSEQERQNAFRKQIEVSNPAYFRYKYDTTAIQIADLKARLSSQKAQFVSYFVGDSALYSLSVSGSRDTLIRQPLGAYRQAVRAYMALLANPDAMNQTAGMRQFLALGNSLYRQLLAPLGLSAGRVIVSPDGPFVPFEALSRSATRADYAVTSQAFSYAYSAGLLLKKRSDARGVGRIGQSSFLGVAPVQFASVLKQVSLPGSDDALKTIASRFASPVLLLHGQASRRGFLNQTNQARVVHLFTHAMASDSTGTEPRLYFADSVLNVSDLRESLLQTELVVLAACKTGVGANERGEGVFSLARGFAALGVPSVVTTLWNVENRATYAITADFYRYLADGLPKDEALQQAKLNWLGTTDGTGQLPNYWAGLIIVGDTEPLDRGAPWPWLAGGLGLILAGAGSIWWWRKNRGTMPVASWLQPA